MDYYKILGVEKKATLAEIRSAYHKLSLKLHPDRNPGDAENEKRFKEISEAYTVLSDEASRTKYDNSLKPPAPPKYPVANVSVEVELDGRECTTGADKVVTVTRPRACRDCRGSGFLSSRQNASCVMCQGTGCPTCNYQGTVWTNYCARCWNTGRETELTTITVTIPPGTPPAGRGRFIARGDLWGTMKGPFYVDANVRQRISRPGLVVRR